MQVRRLPCSKASVSSSITCSAFAFGVHVVLDNASSTVGHGALYPKQARLVTAASSELEKRFVPLGRSCAGFPTMVFDVRTDNISQPCPFSPYHSRAARSLIIHISSFLSTFRSTFRITRLHPFDPNFYRNADRSPIFLTPFSNRNRRT